MKNWAVPLGLMVAMGGIWWLSVHLQKPSLAETEAEVHAHLKKTGASPSELCAHAKEVEQQYVREGDRASIDHWAERRKLECLNADICATLIGGCAGG